MSSYICNNFFNNGLAYIASEVVKPDSTFKASTTLSKIAHFVKGFFVSFADWFLLWSNTYRCLKNKFIKALKQKDVKQLPASSYNWHTFGKLALITAGLALGIWMYHSSCGYNSWEQLSLQGKEEIMASLNPVCNEAVRNYCKNDLNGKLVCLKDYLSENWQPIVHSEYDLNVLCSVNLKADNCSSFVGQPTVGKSLEETSFIFRRNFESIKAWIPDDFSEKAKYALQKFVNPQTGQIAFKSHIICVD